MESLYRFKNLLKKYKKNKKIESRLIYFYIKGNPAPAPAPASART